MKKSYILMLIFAFFLSFNLYSRVVLDDLAGAVRTFWNDSSGLPSNTLLDIVQDDVGYIWLASYDGLIRFDGLTFTKFTRKEHGFTGRSPRVLCKGNDGSLWIGTNASGLYNYKNKKFIHYGLESGLPNVSIRAIKFDENNKLYVGTAGGIAILGEDGKFIPLSSDVNSNLGTISFILPVKDTIWVGSNLNGVKVIKDGKIVTPSYLAEAQNEIFSAGYLDFDGSIWLGTVSGKMFQIKNDNIFKVYEFESMHSASINGFVRLKSGTMFVASYKGLGRFTSEGYDLFSEKKGLPDKLVSSLCQDKEGNLWLTMKHAGVGKFSRGKFLDITRAAYLPQESINSVLEDSDGNIWSTSDNGIVCLKNETLDLKRKELIDNIVSHFKGVRVRQVREEADGSLFFATYSDNGLLIFHKNGDIETLTKEEGLPNNRVRFSYKDKKGVTWIGSTAGLAFYMNGKVGKVSDDLLPNSFILCALRDSNGSLWVGTDGGGVAKLNIEEGGDHFFKLKQEKVFNNENGLNGNIIFRITEDNQGNLWFSTSEGLTLYKDGTFYSANNAIGYAEDQIFNLICDDFGNVWVIAPQEVILVPLESLIKAVLEEHLCKDMIHYNKLDGITGQLVANSWLYLTSSNKLFIPTSKGVSLCDPRYDVSNNLPPPVVIENIVIDDKVFEAFEKKLRVPATCRRISFKFTALSYTVPERVHFEYQLEGYDKKWLSCGTSREIAYTNLNPGNYVFKVRATNNDGIVNKNGFYISFYKEAFFYQTIWFYVFLFVIISALIFLVVELRLHSLKAKALELDMKVKEKTQELEAEKEKSDSLLANVLPFSIIEELIETGKARPRLYPAVSILFVDLVDFTKWAGENSCEEVVSKLNKIFTHFDEIMDKTGCERIKTLGDGYMACCGLRGEKAHAERLAEAAIAMLNSIDRLNRELDSNFQIKIAIDSGAVTGGIVGEHKYIFDLFGDPVNTVFRLQSVTSPMGCTVSKNTANLLDEKYPLYKRPNRPLKGKGVCESYYLIYKSSSINSNINIKSLLNELAESFNSKEYTRCRELLAKIDVTLLEPEIAKKVALVRQVLTKV